MTDLDPSRDTPDDSEWQALARVLSGEASADDERVVRQQMERDPARSALVTALDEVQRVAHIAEPGAPDIESALKSVKSRRGVKGVGTLPSGGAVVSLDVYRRRWKDARFRAAAAVLIVAAAGMLWRTVSGPTSDSNASVSAPAHFATAVGQLDSLTLPDGSRLLLGPGSELTLDKRFASGTREVTLNGEARFEVRHDGVHPFIVHTTSATFRDIGTVFSVHSDAAEGARIVVMSGSVALRAAGGATDVTLNGGDRAEILPDASLRVERSGATSDDLAWTTGRLMFRDASVAQVTADLRRWYGVELVVEGALATKTVTATCEHCGARDMGAIVAAMLGGRLESRGDTLHVVPTSAGEQK